MPTPWNKSLFFSDSHVVNSRWPCSGSDGLFIGSHDAAGLLRARETPRLVRFRQRPLYRVFRHGSYLSLGSGILPSAALYASSMAFFFCCSAFCCSAFCGALRPLLPLPPIS